MPRLLHEPDGTAAEDRNHSFQRTVFRSAALLAERLFCRTFVDRWLGATFSRAGRGCTAGPERRWRPRRSALARPNPTQCRAHEARGRPTIAKAHVGGDGAAGVRPGWPDFHRVFIRH